VKSNGTWAVSLALAAGVVREFRAKVCFGRSSEVRADFTTDRLLAYTGRPVKHFYRSASDG